jgi:hypothetical protein
MRGETMDRYKASVKITYDPEDRGRWMIGHE